jgi:hypothetical protein
MELITLERLKSQNLNKRMELSDYVLKASTKNGIVRLRTDWTTIWKHYTSSHPTYGQQGLRGLGTTHNDPLRSNFKYNRTCFLIRDDSARRRMYIQTSAKRFFFWGGDVCPCPERNIVIPWRHHNEGECWENIYHIFSSPIQGAYTHLLSHDTTTKRGSWLRDKYEYLKLELGSKIRTRIGM